MSYTKEEVRRLLNTAGKTNFTSPEKYPVAELEALEKILRENSDEDYLKELHEERPVHETKWEAAIRFDDIKLAINTDKINKCFYLAFAIDGKKVSYINNGEWINQIYREKVVDV